MAYKILTGDNIESLKELPDNSIDAVVTDAPYGLGKEPDPLKLVSDWITKGFHEIRGRGFMGKEWDAFVPQPLFWKEVFRVLKPGGYVLCFFGTRTYDWGTLAIRLAGFEIRDQIGWAFGSGFPKSMDISKSIDKRRDDSADILRVTSFLADAAELRNISRSDVDAHMGTSDMGGWWLSRLQHRCQCPKWEQWISLKEFLGLSDEMDAEVWRLNGRKGTPGESWAEREVIGSRTGVDTSKQRIAAPASAQGLDGSTKREFDITAPASENAKQWEGWGTALKPAWEPICVARKPVEGTITENVLKYGTGALNVDACRIGETGRWPANLAHDGSDEVVELMPEGRAGGAVSGTEPSQTGVNTYGVYGRVPFQSHNDEGNAARFFYCAKATKEDRDEGCEHLPGGNIHPTVKPTDLMRWLVKLVTPPGGTVLDPFAGSGTTGKACIIDGFDCILMELDQSDGQKLGYEDIIRARCDYAQNNRAKYFMPKEDQKTFNTNQLTIF